MEISAEKIAGMIEHVALKADTTPADVEKVCAEALQYRFAAVAVNGCYVPLVAKLLAGSDINVCCSVGFPLGAMQSATKAFEAEKEVESGAGEVDMLINVGMLKAGDFTYVCNDIAMVAAAVAGKAVLKVILETCLLTDEEKKTACKIAVDAGAAFVKTSTGFSTGGATVADVRLMRAAVGPDIGVKASGGIKTREDVVKLIEAGANRIGTSSSVSIIR